MRIEGLYPSPIHGVSTLSPRNRRRGTAGLQVNFRSDPVKKLTRRPPLQYETVLRNQITYGDIHHHRYTRDGVVYRILIDKSDGTVTAFRDNQPITVAGDLSDYIGYDITTQTVDGTTYVVNKETEVEMLPDIEDGNIERVSHVNVTAALAYGETLRVNITQSDGTRTSRIVVVPALIASGNPEDPPDYDRADKARATSAVAKQLAENINNSIPDTSLNAAAFGSTVAIWEDGRNNWVDVEIETGQGDRSTIAINRTIENVDGLPLYAVVGTRIKVRPNPTSEKGVYYLQAERTSDIPTGEPLEEVVWAESRSPVEPYKFDTSTMPHQIKFQENNVLVGEVEWKDRQVGDDESVPQPEFVGQTITGMSYFQKRLVFLSENFAIMSETDDVRNFWRQSAVNLLVSDMVSISSSAIGVDKLEYIVPHNRDLLIVSSNAQFKIDGSTAITPQTVSMALTTKYDCQTSVPPVTMGNSVFFPIDYGNSTGLQEYTGEKDTGQDFATPVTHEVIGYMQGKARVLTASPNLNMIVMLTNTIYDSALYVYEKSTVKDSAVGSWSEWDFGGGAEIIDAYFQNDELELICVEDSNVYLKVMRMYSQVQEDVDVYLDDLLVLDTQGATGTLAYLPNYYVQEDLICVRGKGTDNELFKVGFEITGNTIVFNEPIGQGKVYVGKLYESRYRPTRPFRYNEDGQAITTDRLRVGRFTLGLVETNEIKMSIVSDFYDTPDQVFNSRYVNGLANKLGTIPFYTGNYKFSYAQDANLADVEFYCDNWLGCTINSISWEGQYYQSKGRM
ncbi:putative tail tubular protein B [Alteromonas phage vB_AspP-H4/4]|uniref:Tail tubular protein B n=1 Tax=Alteromonas phage vB_AspP-H4/4 TaxID=2928692 RepID=A0A220YL74_9CAUD|nr:putative tail tubular protein B [Alteromonas phage vB_AspP-H4/4]ASL24419.1 putative tail tubular protein B [Alteromonas phage vB_AspP-H4/4]